MHAHRHRASPRGDRGEPDSWDLGRSSNKFGSENDWSRSDRRIVHYDCNRVSVKRMIVSPHWYVYYRRTASSHPTEEAILLAPGASAVASRLERRRRSSCARVGCSSSCVFVGGSSRLAFDLRSVGSIPRRLQPRPLCSQFEVARQTRPRSARHPHPARRPSFSLASTCAAALLFPSRYSSGSEQSGGESVLAPHSSANIQPALHLLTLHCASLCVCGLVRSPPFAAASAHTLAFPGVDCVADSQQLAFSRSIE